MSKLTRGMTGEPVPKQYCRFGRDEPMVRWALRRAGDLVPASRILVVVAEQHRRFWRKALAGIPRENVLVQPRNRGTAAGILLPALEIVLRRDREARLVVLPADHHVGAEAVLRNALLAAVRSLRRPDARLVLLGMTGEGDDLEFGWIVPSPGPTAALRAVDEFVEKPDARITRRLADRGALINSLIFAAQGRTLLRLYQDWLPGLLRSFLPVVATGSEPDALRALYDEIPTRDFSRAVLERCAPSLAVLTVPPCAWSDLGTPRRLTRFLEEPARPHTAAIVGRGLAEVRLPETGFRESLQSQS